MKTRLILVALALVVGGCKSIPNPVENREKPAPAEFGTAAPDGNGSLWGS